jgi:hypothetical protein
MGLLDRLWLTKKEKERWTSKIQRINQNMRYYRAITSGAFKPVYEKARHMFPGHLKDLPHSPNKADYQRAIQDFVSEDFTLATAVNQYLTENKEPDADLKGIIGEDTYNQIIAHPEALGYFVERFNPETNTFSLTEEEVIGSQTYINLATEKAELQQAYGEVMAELHKFRVAGELLPI